MSSTLALVRNNVRVHLRDLDARDYVVTTEELDMEITTKSQEMVGQALPGLSWSLAALSLASGASDAAFTAGDRVAIVSVRCVQTGRIVPRWPRDMVESRRETSGSQPTGQPDAHYLIEQADGTLTARFVPNANQAYTFDVLLSALPLGPDGSGGYAATADSTVIPWADLMVRAIEKAVAITLVMKMTPEQLARIRINPAVIKQWAEDVENLVRAEQKRQARRFRIGYLTPAVGP